MQGIGVDADQAYLGDQIMTSALKKVDVAVYNAIKAVQDGTFKAAATPSSTSSAAAWASVRPTTSAPSTPTQVKEVQDKIASGELTDIPDTVK